MRKDILDHLYTSQSVCIVIHEFEDTCTGYIPIIQQEVTGSSVAEVKEKAMELINSLNELPQQMSPTVITFLDLPSIHH